MAAVGPDKNFSQLELQTPHAQAHHTTPTREFGAVRVTLLGRAEEGGAGSVVANLIKKLCSKHLHQSCSRHLHQTPVAQGPMSARLGDGQQSTFKEVVATSLRVL